MKHLSPFARSAPVNSAKNDLRVVIECEQIEGKFGGKLQRLVLSCGHALVRSRRGNSYGQTPGGPSSPASSLEWCGKCLASRIASQTGTHITFAGSGA